MKTKTKHRKFKEKLSSIEKTLRVFGNIELEGGMR